MLDDNVLWYYLFNKNTKIMLLHQLVTLHHFTSYIFYKNASTKRSFTLLRKVIIILSYNLNQQSDLTFFIKMYVKVMCQVLEREGLLCN